jgi:hypothetical protein
MGKIGKDFKTGRRFKLILNAIFKSDFAVVLETKGDRAR